MLHHQEDLHDLPTLRQPSGTGQEALRTVPGGQYHSVERTKDGTQAIEDLHPMRPIPRRAGPCILRRMYRERTQVGTQRPPQFQASDHGRLRWPMRLLRGSDVRVSDHRPHQRRRERPSQEPLRHVRGDGICLLPLAPQQRISGRLPGPLLQLQHRKTYVWFLPTSGAVVGKWSLRGIRIPRQDMPSSG